MRDYLDVLDAAFAGPGAVAVDNDSFRVHSPVDVTDAFEMPVLLAALGPTMLRIAGERTGGTILWMADERAIGDYVVPRITEAAELRRPVRNPRRRRRSRRTLLPTARSTTPARYASEVLGHADFSPNYVRLLEHGDAEDVGDTMAAGDESAVLARLRRYRDAGVTDLAVRVVPLGDDAGQRAAHRVDALRTSSRRWSPNSPRAHSSPMNSTGTPPIVQKNRSTPGVPVSNTVTSLAKAFAASCVPVEIVGQKRQRGQALRRDVAQVLRHVEDLDESGVAGADHGDVRAVGRRPTQRRLENFTRHPQSGTAPPSRRRRSGTRRRSWPNGFA